MAVLCGIPTMHYSARSARKNFAFVWKNDPLRLNFRKCAPKFFIASPIDVFCSNIVKFGRQEIGEIVRCGRRRQVGDISCTGCTGQGNYFELILMVKWKLDIP